MFSPYTGPWTFEEAAHLLRRTVFGPSKARIQQAVDEGLDGTITTLFSQTSPPAPPIHFRYENDPGAPIGETWINTPPDDATALFPRGVSLRTWWMRQIGNNDQTILEKITLFWHNHFPISKAGYANSQWLYLNLLRDFALGDFREFTKRITIDICMLDYLNGLSNVASEPNENYARELLELFTIGKGPLVAPGDYTNYTEEDIAAVARALTGWIASTGHKTIAVFVESAHDNSTKQLSYRFDNQTIANEGAEEYKRVIDIIFEKEEVAYHICRRLYIWFVNYDITDEIEAEIIAPMAQLLLSNNYIIKPALEALLKSQHFFDLRIRGAIIKNPVDYFMSYYYAFKIELPADIIEQYHFWNRMYWDFAASAGMYLLVVPSVAGWPAYHQGPRYYENWINTSYLTLRKNLMDIFLKGLHSNSPEAQGHDFLKFIETLDNPSNINDLINEVCQLIYPRAMPADQKATFKEFLIPGLPDFEWIIEYNNFLANPDDLELKMIMENKLKNLFVGMMNLPEFQLS